MLYKSTRGNTEVVNSQEAVVKGLCDDGGLFVPVDFPNIKLDLEEMKNYSYKEVACKILEIFFGDFSKEEIKNIVDNSYDGKFSRKELVDVVKGGDGFFIELYHGPTSAFKDMALSVLPHLMIESSKKISGDKEIVILTATSGDTGKAALEGFSNVDGIKIVVYYPSEGVSQTQRLQMVSQEGNNVKVYGINGNFDDAQKAVKEIFVNKELREEMAKNNKAFSSANSINIGRLVPQIVYYVYSYLQLVNRGEISLGDKVNIVVPCGNFGNILAAYYGKKLGLPVNKFICASNTNKVLTDFFNTGVYDRNRDMDITVSPSMDILVSSNLERYLYEISDNDESFVKSAMESLQKDGRYSVKPEHMEKMKRFYGGFCNDEETLATIKEMYENNKYLMDTHTAVAYKVYEDYVKETGDKTKTLIASTASPYKFSEAVCKGLGIFEEGLTDDEMMDKLHEYTSVDIPKNLFELRNKKAIHNDIIDKSTIIENLKKYLELGE